LHRRGEVSKERIMVRMSQRKGIAAIVLLSLILPAAGCVNSGVEPAIIAKQGAAPADAGNSSGIQQAKFDAPMALAQGQDAHPEKPPVLGMPTPVNLVPANLPLPTEKAMVSHPPHRVAPPDILVIEALRLVPRGPYRLEPMEVLQVEITGAFKDAIKGLYMISPEGTINLGHTLLPIPVAGLTLDRAQLAITEYVRKVVKTDFSVNLTLVQMRGLQNVRGEHLVRPDGTISLGIYGSVYVAGMTLGQVKCTIENHLSAYLISPQVSVDVLAYNSRKIYIIADGAGYGQQVIALPATGNETVLDAISRVQGLPPVASLKKIWVARPAPAGHPCSQILPVSWQAIVQGGDTATNYQLLPGDRIYISSDPMIRAYNYLDKMIAPIERILGVTLLGTTTVQTIRNGTTTTGLVIR
jgi:polysaccharide biosynthesis/export protein